DGLKFGVYDGAVKVNKVKAGTAVNPVPGKIDWSTFTETTDSLPVPTMAVPASVDLSAQGSVALDAFGVLIAKGSFKLDLGAVQGQGVQNKTYQAMTLTLGSAAFTGASRVEVFVGVGGVLKDESNDDNSSTGSFRDDTVNTDAGVGFYASLDS